MITIGFIECIPWFTSSAFTNIGLVYPGVIVHTRCQKSLLRAALSWWHTWEIYYDDVIKCKHFPRYCPFVRGTTPSPQPMARSFDVSFDLPSRKCSSKKIEPPVIWDAIALIMTRLKWFRTNCIWNPPRKHCLCMLLNALENPDNRLRKMSFC